MLSATFIRERGEEKGTTSGLQKTRDFLWHFHSSFGSLGRLCEEVETTSELRITQLEQRSELTEDKECSRNKEENAV